jgi:hypothetical protein
MRAARLVGRGFNPGIKPSISFLKINRRGGWAGVLTLTESTLRSPPGWLRRYGQNLKRKAD